MDITLTIKGALEDDPELQDLLKQLGGGTNAPVVAHVSEAKTKTGKKATKVEATTPAPAVEPPSWNELRDAGRALIDAGKRDEFHHVLDGFDVKSLKDITDPAEQVKLLEDLKAAMA